MDIASTLFALVLATTLDWIPHDRYPQMQYGASIVAPANATGISLQVVSEYQFIQYSVWVKDEDEWMNPSGGGIEKVINALVDISPALLSGTLEANSTSFQNGTRTETFAIKAIQVPANTVLIKIDRFTPVDTGTGVVKDAAVEQPLEFIVTIAGPAGNGGGGSG